MPSLAAITWSWRLLAVSLYVLSALLVSWFLWADHPRAPRWFRAAGARAWAIAGQVRLGHAVAIALGAWLLLLPLLLWTVQRPEWTGQLDMREFWYPVGQIAASGGNPHIPWSGEEPNFLNASNFGMGFTALMALGYALGGLFGISALLALASLAAPVAAYLVARTYFGDDARSGWTYMLALVLPMSVLWAARGGQDEPLTAIPILLSLWLVRRDRLGTAAIVAGLGASVKYLPLLTFAAFLLVHYRARIGAENPWRPTRAMVPYAVSGAAALAAFGATVVLGHTLYGDVFITRTLLMDSLPWDGRGITVVESLIFLIGPQWLHRAFLAALLIIYLWLLVRPTSLASHATDLRAAVFILLATLVVSPYVNHDSVVFGMGLLVLAGTTLARSAPRVTGLRGIIASPALALGISAMTDLDLMYLALDPPRQGHTPWPFEILYTISYGLVAWVALRWWTPATSPPTAVAVAGADPAPR